MKIKNDTKRFFSGMKIKNDTKGFSKKMIGFCLLALLILLLDIYDINNMPTYVGFGLIAVIAVFLLIVGLAVKNKTVSMIFVLLAQAIGLIFVFLECYWLILIVDTKRPIFVILMFIWIMIITFYCLAIVFIAVQAHTKSRVVIQFSLTFALITFIIAIIFKGFCAMLYSGEGEQTIKSATTIFLYILLLFFPIVKVLRQNIESCGLRELGRDVCLISLKAFLNLIILFSVCICLVYCFVITINMSFYLSEISRSAVRALNWFELFIFIVAFFVGLKIGKHYIMGSLLFTTVWKPYEIHANSPQTRYLILSNPSQNKTEEIVITERINQVNANFINYISKRPSMTRFIFWAFALAFMPLCKQLAMLDTLFDGIILFMVDFAVLLPLLYLVIYACKNIGSEKRKNKYFNQLSTNYNSINIRNRYSQFASRQQPNYGYQNSPLAIIETEKANIKDFSPKK